MTVTVCTRGKRVLWRAALFALLTTACVDSEPICRLAVGDEFEFEMEPGAIRRFSLTAEAEDFMQLTVVQDEIDVESRLFDPSGELVIAVDRFIGDSGPEVLRAIREEGGVYTLEIRAFERTGDPGRVTLRFDTLRPTIDDQDPQVAEDQRATERLRRLRHAEGLVLSSKLNEAVSVYQTVIEQSAAAIDGDLWSEAKVRLASALRRLGLQEEAHRHLQDVAGAEELGEPIWRILALDSLAFMDLVDRRPRAAIQHVEQALAIPEIEGLPLRRGRLYSNLGRARQMQGAIQHALDAYDRANEFLRPWDREYRASLLQNLGALHRHYLGRPESALDFFQESAEMSRELSDQAVLASTLNQIGECHESLGEKSKAETSYQQALEIRRDLWDRCAVANTLIRLALLEREDPEEGVEQQMIAWASEARSIVEAEGCSHDGQAIRSRLAEFAERQGDLETACNDYRRNRDDARTVGHRDAEVEALFGLARCSWESSDPKGERCPRESLSLTTRALEIVEDVRAGLAREDFRLAFASRTQALFELHIDLQWQCKEPGAALETARKARARALLDRLRQIDADVSFGAGDEVLEQARQLLYELTRAENERLERAREGSLPPDGSMSAEIDALVDRLSSLEAKIGREHPAYFRLMRAQPASLDEIQSLLDEETALAVFKVGHARSYLWVVTGSGIEGFELGIGRAEIEEEVLTIREGLVSRAQSPDSPAWSPTTLEPLAEIILPGAAMEYLALKRRWMVVADGVLELLPFVALPNSATPARPLLVDHEIVYLPSASAWVELRARSERPAASGLLAVVADPVYGPDDPRLLSSARAAPGASLGGFKRLPGTGLEADAILEQLPEGAEFLDLRGLKATRESVISGALRSYRLVHLAVHGEVHPRQPLLSYLALARWDEAGRALAGNLFAHEVYGLGLDAELVVLAACDTGLGSLVPGEGLVSGLTRGFLYAGAERVIVSLWPVSDLATSELMPRFYARLFDGDDPVLALHEAQRELYREGALPYAWAGFVIQGG